MTFYRKVSLRRFFKSEEPKQGKNIRGDINRLFKKRQPKEGIKRKTRKVYKFWTRSKTNLLKEWLPFLITV
jgi:hypothetical protein